MSQAWLAEAIDSYTADAAILGPLLPPDAMQDKGGLEPAEKVRIRAYTTEFEYKAGRHLARGRKKKELIGDQAKEHSAKTKRDWRIEGWPLLVAEFEKILAGTGP